MIMMIILLQCPKTERLRHYHLVIIRFSAMDRAGQPIIVLSGMDRAGQLIIAFSAMDRQRC